jgi:CheY-like chemotaxis protein
MNFAELVLSDGEPKPVFPASGEAGDGDLSLTAGMRALIVEDEIMVAWHLESVLEDLRMEVCGLVSNASEAIAEATKDNVDIVFMDVNLAGEINGIEAARMIRERRSVPIVFVTAYASDEATVAKIASVLGPSVVVGKPATPEAIRAAVLRLKGI